MTEIVAGWVGDSFVPLKRHEKLCAENFVIGQRYILEVGYQQSATKRAMFHATIADVYTNLPDEIAARYIDVTHFRKSLTIAAGYATEMQFACASKAEAARLAAALRSSDVYSVVKVERDCVTQFHAKSTSTHSMDGETFSRMVDDVLALAGGLISVELKELRKLHAHDKLRADLEASVQALPAPASRAEDHVRAEPQRPLSHEEAIALLPDAPGIDAAAPGDRRPHTWLRSCVVDFLSEATEIRRFETARTAGLRAVGPSSIMFFRIAAK